MSNHRIAVDAAVFAPGLWNLDLVEAGLSGLQRTQCFLQGFREGTPDRHGFADRLHRSGQGRLRTLELLESEARHLDDDVVDGRLEGGRGHLGDVVQQLVQAVADGQLGGDLGDWEAGRLGGKG